MRPEYEKGEQESDEREDGGSGKKDSVVFKNPVLFCRQPRIHI